ncbi:MAG: MFS transporter, partial [Desulfobacterales bacterium]|nr:MFS transporter [Desulfobacterales bacterium]
MPKNRYARKGEMNGLDRTEKYYRGWYVVAGAFAILVIVYGARYSFGVFVKPMFAEFGWPMTTISLAASINLVVYASGGVVAGRLLDTFAPKWIMTAGVVTTALGFFLVSYAKTPLGLYLCYGVLVGLGAAGAGMVVCGAAVGKWFVRRRGLAIGLASTGIGLGTMFMAPLAGYIVTTFGWRTG